MESVGPLPNCKVPRHFLLKHSFSIDRSIERAVRTATKLQHISYWFVKSHSSAGKRKSTSPIPGESRIDLQWYLSPVSPQPLAWILSVMAAKCHRDSNSASVWEHQPKSYSSSPLGTADIKLCHVFGKKKLKSLGEMGEISQQSDHQQVLTKVPNRDPAACVRWESDSDIRSCCCLSWFTDPPDQNPSWGLRIKVRVFSDIFRYRKTKSRPIHFTISWQL